MIDNNHLFTTLRWMIELLIVAGGFRLVMMLAPKSRKHQQIVIGREFIAEYTEGKWRIYSRTGVLSTGVADEALELFSCESRENAQALVNWLDRLPE